MKHELSTCGIYKTIKMEQDAFIPDLQMNTSPGQKGAFYNNKKKNPQNNPTPKH